MKNKIKILFWKIYAIIWDLKPRIHLPKYIDYPIAYCDITDKYSYPKNIKVLFEWDEIGHHWIVFTRKQIDKDDFIEKKIKEFDQIFSKFFSTLVIPYELGDEIRLFLHSVINETIEKTSKEGYKVQDNIKRN